MNASTVLLYIGSLGLVLWAIVDVSRRSYLTLAPRRKMAWIVGMIFGWLLFGVFGALIAAFYLVGPRRQMNLESKA